MKKILFTLSAIFVFVFNYATNLVVVNAGLTFSPDSITITQGDSVTFSLNNPHNAQEVSLATWQAGNSTPVTGFSTPVGGGLVTGLSVGTHYFVCSPHASMGMKGKIVVLPAPPSVQFVVTSSSVSEGVGTYDIAVSINNPDQFNATSVDVNVVAGATATANGVDYNFSPLTVTFPAADPFTKNVTITVTNDQLVEGNENFTLKLVFPTNGATIGANSQHTVTIVDNDTLKLNIYPPRQEQFENAVSVNVPVELTNLSANPTSVTLQLQAGTTATQNVDFYFNDTTITWAANASGIIFIPVGVQEDLLFEPDETVRIKMVNPTNGAVLLNDTFLLVIKNNDTIAPVNCGDLFFSEYIDGTGSNKALEIFNPTTGPVNLADYSILKSTNGSAANTVFGLNGTLPAKGVYVAANNLASGSITAQADTLSAFFDFNGNDALALIHSGDTIDIIGQLGVNPGTGWAVDTGSTFHHTLIRSYYNYHGDTNWTSASQTWKAYPTDMADSLGFHHTADCGTPEPATINFISAGVTVDESIGTVAIIARVNNPTNNAVNFIIARDDASSSATIVFDYTSQNIGFTEGQGVFYDTIYAHIIDDQLIEPTEEIKVKLIPVSGAINIMPDSVYTITILDNDTLSVSFNGAGFSYVEDTGMVEVKVIISSPVPDTTSAVVSLAAGNATLGVDYLFTQDTVTFLPNTTDTLSVWVTIIDDAITELNEQINFNLTAIATNARVGIWAYTLTIIDNDLPSGLEEQLLADGVKIYPNPVHNLLTLETSSEFRRGQVTDLSGQLLIDLGRLPEGKNRIDVSSLSAGMYFINVQNGDALFTKRFIKQD